jgi:hypothetical protein
VLNESEIKQRISKASKKITVSLAEEVLSEPENFEILLKISLSDEKPYSWRAAWVMNSIAENDPSLIIPSLPRIMKKLPQFKFDSQLGTFLRVLLQIEAKYLQYGKLVDTCIGLIANSKKQQFLKFYSIKLLRKLALYEKGLIQEVILTLETYLPLMESANLRRHARMVIEELEKKGKGG